ncbi:hypothetical protein D3C78_845080 [compost metagenome]
MAADELVPLGVTEEGKALFSSLGYAGLDDAANLGLVVRGEHAKAALGGTLPAIKRLVIGLGVGGQVHDAAAAFGTAWIAQGVP